MMRGDVHTTASSSCGIILIIIIITIIIFMMIIMIMTLRHYDITRATRQRLCLQEPTQPKNDTKRTSLEKSHHYLWNIWQKSFRNVLNVRKAGSSIILSLPTLRQLPRQTREAAIKCMCLNRAISGQDLYYICRF